MRDFFILNFNQRNNEAFIRKEIGTCIHNNGFQRNNKPRYDKTFVLIKLYMR